MYRITNLVILTFLLVAGCSSGKMTAEEEKKFYAENKAKNVAMYQDDCDAGSAKDCYAYGLVLLMGFEGKEGVSRGPSLVQEGCEKGFMEACLVIGNLTRRGALTTLDVEKGIQYITTSCDGEHAKACQVLGDIYKNGDDVERDEAKSNALYEKACRLDAKLCG